MPVRIPAAAPAVSAPPSALRWLAPAVLAAGLALTAGLSAWAWNREAATQQARFERNADRLVQALANRVQSYVDTLPGLRAFAAAGRSLDDAAFMRYVDTISLERRFPGLALTFIAQRVRGEERSAYVAAVRGDRSRIAEGHADFEIRPPGTRPEHMVIRHVQPSDSATFGYDLFDPDQRYRAEVDAALRSGGYVATGPLLLARDRDAPMAPSLTSVVIRAATYASALPPAEEAQRLQRADGVVGIAFRTVELLRSIEPADPHEGLHLRITDPRAAQEGRPALVFDSGWRSAPNVARCRPSRCRWPTAAGRSRSDCWKAPRRRR